MLDYYFNKIPFFRFFALNRDSKEPPQKTLKRMLKEHLNTKGFLKILYVDSPKTCIKPYRTNNKNKNSKLN